MGNDLVVHVLGNLEVRRGDEHVAIGGPKPRLLLAMLIGARGSVVSLDRLSEELWADEQPADPGAVLQSNVSRLRRILAPEVQIVARPPGYVLTIADDAVDAWSFEAACRAARAASTPAAAVVEYESALAQWNGTPFAEFGDREWARADVTRLEEAHVAAREELLSTRLDLGQHHAVVGELEALVAEHPLRERPWVLLALALHRCGRSADALRRISSFRSILRDELGLDPPAAIRELERQILDADPALLAATTPRATRRSQLRPTELTPLVGRSADVAGLLPMLGRHGLITLVGPGGVGKTRLALRLAAAVWDERADEVYVVELAPVHDPLLTVASVATAIDVQQRQHLSLEDTLVEFLRGRRALVVLDNCEHLRGSVARITERLLASCPDLTVLATSREVLGLPGEQLWRVDPLQVADASSDAASISQTAAVRLFVDRATASNPGFVLGPDNVQAVAEIVRRVDGLPLAIELAAARLRAISPAALADRLGRRFDLLDHAQFTAVARHQTVADLVGWSFNLLTPDEQSLFARVSVFAGSFGLDAVETICDDTAGNGSSAARLLAALVDKSMVQMIDANAGRYRVLEPLREFGAAQLDDEALASLHRQHACWYLDLARRSAMALAGPDEAAAAARLDVEFDNLRSAFSWSVEARELAMACALVVDLREYSFRSMRAEVIGWADDVIAMPGFDDEPTAPLVLGIAAYGRFARGDLDSSIEYGRRAMAAAERLGTPTSGLAERALGNSLFYQGHADEAQHWIERMLDNARHGSQARLAHGLYMRSVACVSVRDTHRGVELAEEALIAARRCGSPTALAQASYALGLALEASDVSAASSLLTQGVELAAGAGNRWIQAFALTEVLWLEAQRGSPRTALAGFADVIDLWFRGGDWANQWLSLRHVFGILVQLGDHRAAATLHGALTAVGAAYALPFEASDADRLNELVGKLRDEVGVADFAGAVRRGASMRDGEIIEFVQERIRALTA